MSNTNNPHDIDAEKALLGAVILSPTIIEDVGETILPSDLYLPRHSTLLNAVYSLWGHGERIDAITVTSEARKLGSDVTVADVSELITEAGSGWRSYAEIILDKALRRRLIVEARTLLQEATDERCDSVEALEKHRANIATIDTALVASEPDDISIEEFVARTKSTPDEWVIKGIIRKGHRIVIVGGEGSGKSMLLQQIGVASAYGIHAFRRTPIKPVSVLIVDLENPEDVLHNAFSWLLNVAGSVTQVENPFDRLLWRPGGIDLRRRSDRAELENVIAKRRPDLVLLGPLYKSYSVSASEGYELPAREVQQAIDKLRARYGFSIIMEDHAPQASGGQRDMRPYGSSFWLRWPEIGIGMTPAISNPDGERVLSRWRGDRTPIDWPSSLMKGGDNDWPWKAVYNRAEEDAF